MPTPLIYELKDIEHRYLDRVVLSIDHLCIEKGSITGLLGPNGSGKTTLLKLLGFAEKPSAGEILFKGSPQEPFSKAVRSRVTLLTQEPYLLKRTVFENIAYGLKIRKKTSRLEGDVRNALNLVGLDFNVFSTRKWHELSGGEAQRVAMAARLVLNPEVLLLDEPTASVDTESARLIKHASLKAREILGTTLVVASHDWHWLYEISDYQLHIFNGRVFSTGMENILTGPWESDPDSHGTLVAKKIGDGQAIRAALPPGNEMVVLIKDNDISIDPSPGTGNRGQNSLNGTITRMILERKTMDIVTTVTVHDIFFTLRLRPDEISRLTLYPGKPVTLTFNPSSVTWI